MRVKYGPDQNGWIRRMFRQVRKRKAIENENYLTRISQTTFPRNGDLHSRIGSFFDSARDILSWVNMERKELFTAVTTVILDKLPAEFAQGAENIKGQVLNGTVSTLSEVQEKLEEISRLFGSLKSLGFSTPNLTSKGKVIFGSKVSNPNDRPCTACGKQGHRKGTCPTKGYCTSCKPTGHNSYLHY